MNDPWFGNFGQISFGVTDLQMAVRFWERQMGVGPWSLFYGLTFDAKFEGRRVSFPFDVAIGWHDGRIVELIHVLGDGPSPLHDGLNRPIIGLQRLASVTDDIERDRRAAEARGLEPYASGNAGGQRFTYYRSNAAPGVILELLERTPSFTTLCDDLAARAAEYQAVDAPVQIMPSVPPSVATMRAALLSAYGGPELFSVGQVPVPVPGSRQVRIKVAGAAVNPVDGKLRRGLLKEWMPLRFPARLGGDVSGTIDAIGSDVDDFRVGDRVAGFVAPNVDGAYGEWLVAPAVALVRVPERVDLADAAAYPTGVLTGVQLIEAGIRPRAGDTLLVTGAGGSTGRAAVLSAIEAGARVYAGIRASSREAVADLDVAGVIDLSDPQALAAAGPFDAVADTVGGAVAEGLFAYVRPDGIVASIAMPPPVPPAGATQRFCSLIVRFDRERLERFMRDHTMPVAHRLPLEETGEAHRLLEAGGVGGKIVLQPSMGR